MEGFAPVTQYRVPDGVLRAKLDDDEVLLNPTTGVYHLLNPAGRRIVEGLGQGASLDTLIASIATDTDTLAERVRSDTESFVHAMVERGLLEEVQ
jgi:hypothetical protein